MKIYVVTEGEYSDYRIRKVFLDKEKAEKYIEIAYRTRASLDDCTIEEYETSDDIFQAPVYVRCEYYRNERSGHDYVSADDYGYSASDDVPPDSIDESYNDALFYFYLREDSQAFNSSEQLKKVARDRYAAYKARKEGIV